MQTQTPRRRGRPRKNPINQQFPGTVIQFNSRPRLVVGDVVELCRGCLPANHGKLAIITGFQDDGCALVRSLLVPLDTFDAATGLAAEQDMTASVSQENLYRRSSTLAKGY